MNDIDFVYVETSIPKGHPIMLPVGAQVLSYKRARNGGVQLTYMRPRSERDRAANYVVSLSAAGTGTNW